MDIDMDLCRLGQSVSSYQISIHGETSITDIVVFQAQTRENAPTIHHVIIDMRHHDA